MGNDTTDSSFVEKGEMTGLRGVFEMIKEKGKRYYFSSLS
jgi:hypothetical protein